MTKFFVLLAAIPFAFGAIAHPVRIDSGPLEGVPSSVPGVTAFEGIPYGKPHLAVEWGGTVIGPGSAIPMLQAYIKSAERFRDLSTGGDVILTNHTAFDGTLLKNAALLARKPGEPNPWIVGKSAVERYLTVAEECGKANLITAQERAK